MDENFALYNMYILEDCGKISSSCHSKERLGKKSMESSQCVYIVEYCLNCLNYPKFEQNWLMSSQITSNLSRIA